MDEKGVVMIDKKAFRALSYGLYIIGASYDGSDAGCVVNTFQQVTATPARVSVAINKDNATARVVAAAGRFTASCLTEDASMELIGAFGFKSSDEVDKFASCRFARDEAGVPYVAQDVAAWFSVRVIETVDVGTHLLFIGEVERASCVESLSEPMTYAYYHAVKGGKTPPKASSYEGDGAGGSRTGGFGASAPEGVRYAWRCTVCGHIEYVDELPDDFECPLCGMGREMFERIEL